MMKVQIPLHFRTLVFQCGMVVIVLKSVAIQYNMVSEPDSITQLKQTPIFDEWSLARCGSKNDQQIRHRVFERDCTVLKIHYPF